MPLLSVNISNPEEIASRIRLTTEMKPLGSDQNLLIIEAISEILDWKQDLFQQLGYYCLDDTVFEFNSFFSSTENNLKATTRSCLPQTLHRLNVLILAKFLTNLISLDLLV